MRFRDLEKRAGKLLAKHGYPDKVYLRANIARLLSVDKNPRYPSANVDKWALRSVPGWVDGYIGVLELLTCRQFLQQKCSKKLKK